MEETTDLCSDNSMDRIRDRGVSGSGRKRSPAMTRIAAALALALPLVVCADEPIGPLASLTVSVTVPPAEPFSVGDTLRLEPEVRDHRGEALRGVAVAWSSSDARVASVAPSGVVTALGPGIATITATSGGGSGTVRLSVADPTYAALAALYKKTNGDTWTNNDNWLSDANLDSWYGVDADNAGRVVGLDLEDNNLTGHIPLELGDLSDLRRLALAENRLTGPIPPELAKLVHLQALELHTNRLTGEIPPELAKLANLQALELHTNGLTGEISPALGNLEDLGLLKLHSNALTGHIPPNLGNLGTLRELNLSDNALTGLVPPELGELDSLRVLWLAHNELSGSIPAGLGKLANLEVLWLSHNELSGSVPASLGGLGDLEWLLIGNNPLSGPLPITLRGLALEVFGFADTQLCVPRQGSFRAWLAAIPSREGTGVDCSDRAVLEALYDSTAGPNWTDDTNWKSERPLSDWFGVGATPTDMATEVGLDRNNLVGVLPRQLGDLAGLRYLSLNHNRLSGPIPSESGDLANLQILRLRDNRLTGAIPPELGELGNLLQLMLDGNRLSGAIPPELGKLSSLGPLWLHDNQLSGRIPPELGSLDNLTSLVLSDNQLSGIIPAELGGLANLEALVLRYNRLSGPIPAGLDGLANLGQLYLNNNRLTGPIPAEIGSLANLFQLGLDDNRLSGAIPAELGGLANLQYLFLDNNQFTGPIPLEFGNLSSLTWLTLDNNELTGAIPVELARLVSLDTLRVAGNDLCVPRRDSVFAAWLEGVNHDTHGLPSCSGGFRDDFTAGASLTDWTIHNADADVGGGVLRLTNRVEDRLGLAERRAPPLLTGWTITTRMGRLAREASPGVISVTGHDRFAAIWFALATRDSTNYEVALFDAEAERWVSVTNMSGHSEAVMEDTAAFTDVTLGSEGDDFVAYADNDSRDEPAELFRFDMDDAALDGVPLREFLHLLTGTWLINSGPVGLTSLHDWVEVTGTVSGTATAAAAAESGVDPAWANRGSSVDRVRVESGKTPPRPGGTFGGRVRFSRSVPRRWRSRVPPERAVRSVPQAVLKGIGRPVVACPVVRELPRDSRGAYRPRSWDHPPESPVGLQPLRCFTAPQPLRTCRTRIGFPASVRKTERCKR